MMQTKCVLISAPIIPEFDRESGSRRIFYFIVMMRQAEWSVTFHAVNATGGERYIRILQQMGVMVYCGEPTKYAGDDYLPNPKPMIENAQFDLAILAFWYHAESLIPLIRKHSPRTRIIVESIDLHFVRLARATFYQDKDKTPQKLDHDFGRIARRELNAYAAADGVFTVSQKEADWVNDLVLGETHAFAVPDVEDYPYFDTPFAARSGMLFIGNFRHPPNRDAVHYLVKDVLPRIPESVLAHHPLYIVGNALDEEMLQVIDTSPYVVAIGWVPSLQPYLKQCRISVAPIRYGAGINRKIIETLVTGLPTVTTYVGADGFRLQHGEHILIADNPQQFAQSICQLLDDEALWTRLSKQGRENIIETHSPQNVYECMMRAVDEIMKKTPREEVLR